MSAAPCQLRYELMARVLRSCALSDAAQAHGASAAQLCLVRCGTSSWRECCAAVPYQLGHKLWRECCAAVPYQLGHKLWRECCAAVPYQLGHKLWRECCASVNGTAICLMQLRVCELSQGATAVVRCWRFQSSLSQARNELDCRQRHCPQQVRHHCCPLPEADRHAAMGQCRAQ